MNVVSVKASLSSYFSPVLNLLGENQIGNVSIRIIAALCHRVKS
jgi:hypothetical protein